MSSHIRYATHTFNDLESSPFSIEEYSQLKFGDDAVAKKFGYYLADCFAAHYLPAIISNRLVIIPSPYNYVKNAATILTEHFIDRLNAISVENNGENVEASIIHRKLSYVRDYGFLDKETRKGLLDGDSFFINEEFVKDKVLVFIDDVIITGTHEDKLVEILEKRNLKNDCFFLYFAQYTGKRAEIESEINFAAIKSFDDYTNFVKNRYPHIIIRPMKYILSRSSDEVSRFVKEVDRDVIEKLYYGSLAEGYYKLPDYQENFHIIKQAFKNEN